MQDHEKVNILLVDDQPAKLMSYDVILRDLDENLIRTASATEALQVLLKTDVAVVLVDVCMPDLDGFELAAMIREHPRFQRTAIIFISAIHLTDTDHLRGYEMGAVDYVPVPVVPEVLRAKVKVFSELFRKTRQLEKLNSELEKRVAERTAELEASTARLLESERRRSVALAAGQMGSWDWNVVTGECAWDDGQFRIFGVEPENFELTYENIRPLVNAEDMARIEALVADLGNKETFQSEARIVRPNGDVRWCICAAATTVDDKGRIARVSGVTIDITDRKQAEERQLLLAREVDHRARNALAIVQAIVRMTRAQTPEAYVAAVEGRIRALAQAHTLLSQSRWQGADITRLVDEEIAPYRSGGQAITVAGPSMFLSPDKAQILGLALHELATNSVKYGALSSSGGELSVSWQVGDASVTLSWCEKGGPPTVLPKTQGFGTKILNATIKSQMGGDVVLDWRPSGLHCTILIPSGGYEDKPDDPVLARKDSNLVQLPTSNGKRMLLIEDEVLVGLMMRDILVELGFVVVGPVRSVEEGISAARAQHFDYAILDLNLGGELVYPLAECLEQLGVPFIFATGYGTDSVDGSYASVPVLQKPVPRESLEELLRDQLGPGVSVGRSRAITAVPFVSDNGAMT